MVNACRFQLCLLSISILFALSILPCPALAQTQEPPAQQKAPAKPRAKRAAEVRPESGFIITKDKVRIHYLQVNRDREATWQPSLLFVPGWTMPADIWEKQISHFGRTHRVVAMDPRGQGRSAKPRDGYYPAVRARDIKAVVDQLKLAPVVLVGWSMGVPELVSYVDQYGTSDLSGVVLVDGIAGTDPDPKFMGAVFNMAGNYLKDSDKFTDSFIRNMYKTPQTEEYFRKLIAAHKQTPTSVGTALLVGMFSTDLRPALAKIDKPALLCTAPGGPWDAVYEDMAKRIPNARHVKFDGAGHALFVDQADRFNGLLEEFVGSVTVREKQR